MDQYLKLTILCGMISAFIWCYLYLKTEKSIFLFLLGVNVGFFICVALVEGRL